MMIMTLKEILVHLDNTPRCRVRLDVAIALARQHNAHLSGLYATDSPYYSTHRAEDDPAVREAELLFRELTGRADIAADWTCAMAADPVVGFCDRLIRHAYYADLIVLGQGDTKTVNRSVPNHLPRKVAMGAGRPVLIIPNGGVFQSVGNRAVVAWRGGKASSRALHDAIPLLRHARAVSVVWVNPADGFETETTKLCAYLARHGINATVEKVRADDVGIGDVLLNEACDLEADLVVLGIVPQTRRGVADLGPVARHLLEHMTLPVLISG
jgi:nucleotide-binding universal stress UspA family protein